MAADRSQMLTSPAYAALSPSARKVLALIDSKVAHGGGVAAISFSYIERQCGMIHGTSFLRPAEEQALEAATCGFGRIVQHCQGLDAYGRSSPVVPPVHR